MKRRSEEYQALLDLAFQALADQSDSFGRALAASGSAVLKHSMGRSKPAETVLTRREFCSRLMSLRAGRRLC
jgi:hypothetical protein